MEAGRASDESVIAAAREQLVAELQRLGLSTTGSDAVLAARLLLQGDRSRAECDTSAIAGPHNDVGARLHPPMGDRQSPDSPMARSSPLSSGQASRDTIRASRARDSSLNNSTTASSAYNIMRRWNLHFSGAVGEDAETFLLRVEEGRELIPVADEDILRCLPFFLTGIALH